jgi:hypothetical protein
MRFRIWLLAMVVVAGVVAGCSKKQSGSEQESAGPKQVDLGTVQLTSGQPSRHELGGKSVCVLTALPLDAHSIELIAVLEKNGKKVSSTRVSPATTDRPMDISFGDIHVGLTPHMK